MNRLRDRPRESLLKAAGQDQPASQEVISAGRFRASGEVSDGLTSRQAEE
jgi:hypothetical protein